MPSDKFYVQGEALRPGKSKNRIVYTEEEIKKTYTELANKPILKDHINTVDNTIGRTTQCLIKNDEKGMALGYEGWIKEDGTNLLEKIQDGRVCEVSIGAMCDRLVKEKDDSDELTAIGLHYCEMSVTPTPGVSNTRISQNVTPTHESFNDLTQEELDVISKEFEELPEVKKEENIQTEQKAPNAEITEEKNMEEKTEAAPASPPALQESAVDAKIVEATKTLLEEVKALKTEMSELKTEKIKTEAKFKTEAEQVAKAAEGCEGYCIENASKGLALWKMPKANGSF